MQIMKHVRLVKKENNPKNLAVWELAELYKYFVSGYCYGVYDQKEHPALEIILEAGTEKKQEEGRSTEMSKRRITLRL